LWKFSRCDDFSAVPIEDRFEDPILFAGRSSPGNPRRLNAAAHAETQFIQQAISELENLAVGDWGA